MPNESSTGRIQPIYSFYEYSARDTSIPQYDYELETFMVENAVLNRVKKTDNYLCNWHTSQQQYYRAAHHDALLGV